MTCSGAHRLCRSLQNTVDHLYVNTTRGDPVKASFDLTFPNVACGLLSVDVTDDTGAIFFSNRS